VDKEFDPYIHGDPACPNYKKKYQWVIMEVDDRRFEWMEPCPVCDKELLEEYSKHAHGTP